MKLNKKVLCLKDQQMVANKPGLKLRLFLHHQSWNIQGLTTTNQEVLVDKTNQLNLRLKSTSSPASRWIGLDLR